MSSETEPKDRHEALRGWLVRHFGLNAARVQNDSALFSSGLLNSFDMLDLVLYLEKQGHKIGALDVNVENLDSIDKIAAFLDRLEMRAAMP